MGKREKRKSGSGGSFIFGTFIGFILCLGALFGIGCFAYYKVSPAWINKNFKTNIDLGSEEINNKTLSILVNNAINLSKNADTYTLNDLKKDFGIEIKDELYGLDISDLKSVGLKELPEAIENKFGSISAGELRNVNGMNLDSMSKILDKSNVYYFNSEDNKLYKNFDGTNYTNAVNFDYEVSTDKSKVTTKKHQTPILMNSKYNVVNQVSIPLWYLPLTEALGDFTSNMGSQITLQDLETDFGVELPSFLDNVDKQNTTINDLESAINGLYVADFLDYTIDDSDPKNIIVRDKDEQDVTGLMYELAIEKVAKLKNIQDKFDSLTVEDLQGSFDFSALDKVMAKYVTYYVNGTKLYEDEEFTKEVSFKYEIAGANVVVNEKSYPIVGNEASIQLKSLPLATAISAFTSNMGELLTLKELNEDYGVVLPSYIINGNENKTINEIQSIIDNLMVADILGYTIDGDEVMDGNNPVTGIMAIIAKKKVSNLNDLQSTIEEQTIATLMDYKFTTDNKVYKDLNGNAVMDVGEEVTGLLGKVAKYTINNVDSAVNDLELGDVFSQEQLSDGVFKLLDQSTVGSIKVVNVANELSDAIKDSTMGELQIAGLINETYDLTKQIDTNLDGIKDTAISAITLDNFVNIAVTILTK